MFLSGSSKNSSISNAGSWFSHSIPDNIEKIKECLVREVKKQKEIGQCYSALQNKYDNLLRKHAEAENTIDTYRIKINNNTNVIKDSNLSKSVLQLPQKENKCLLRTYSLPRSSITCKDADFLETFQLLVRRVKNLEENVQCIHNGILQSLFDNDFELLEVFEIVKKDYTIMLNELQFFNKKEESSNFLVENIDELNNLEFELYKIGLRLEELHESLYGMLEKNGKGACAINGDEKVEEQLNVSCSSKSEKTSSEKISVTGMSSFNNNNKDYKMLDGIVDARYLSQSLRPVDSNEAANVSHLRKTSDSVVNSRKCSLSTDFKTDHHNEMKCYAKKSSIILNPLNNTEDSGFIESELNNHNGKILGTLIDNTPSTKKLDSSSNLFKENGIDKDFQVRLCFLKDFIYAKQHGKKVKTYKVTKKKRKPMSDSLFLESDLSYVNDQSTEEYDEGVIKPESPLKKLQNQINEIYCIVQSMKKTVHKYLNCEYSDEDEVCSTDSDQQSFYSPLPMSNFPSSKVFKIKGEQSLHLDKISCDNLNSFSSKQLLNNIFEQQTELNKLSEKIDKLADKFDGGLFKFIRQGNEREEEFKILQKLDEKKKKSVGIQTFHSCFEDQCICDHFFTSKDLQMQNTFNFNSYFQNGETRQSDLNHNKQSCTFCITSNFKAESPNLTLSQVYKNNLNNDLMGTNASENMEKSLLRATFAANTMEKLSRKLIHNFCQDFFDAGPEEL
ncbi:uncharacterized protein LOC105848339 isoform X3 [Hydra vulgaris]|uniref:Uncharacterized protein LOC105848339 isoform X3 n=1 Tax=Hydra vulgaris TaxID=6087 RepID=A0ABM4BFA4_HYDVU